MTYLLPVTESTLLRQPLDPAMNARIEIQTASRVHHRVRIPLVLPAPQQGGVAAGSQLAAVAETQVVSSLVDVAILTARSDELAERCYSGSGGMHGQPRCCRALVDAIDGGASDEEHACVRYRCKARFGTSGMTKHGTMASGQLMSAARAARLTASEPRADPIQARSHPSAAPFHAPNAPEPRPCRPKPADQSIGRLHAAIGC